MSLIFKDLQPIKEITHKDILESGLFQLAGSRYMANKYPEIIQVTESTDWDFYCDVSNVVLLNWLASNGVYQVRERNVYPFDALADSIFIGSDFQVIVRTDAEKYKKVIDLIDPEFYRDYLWKSGKNKTSRDQIQAIFNQMFRMV